MGKVLVVFVLLACLAATIWLVAFGWNIGGDTQMSIHGYIAMGLGIAFSLLVGFGLMALVFYSSRSGYDEPARLIPKREQDEWEAEHRKNASDTQHDKPGP